MLRTFDGATKGTDLIRRFSKLKKIERAAVVKSPEKKQQQDDGVKSDHDNDNSTITHTFLRPQIPPKKKKETPEECLRRLRRHFVYKDREWISFSLRALSYQERMDIVKEARDLERDFAYFDKVNENWKYQPQAFLRKDVPGEEESFELLHLPQNSPKWQFLRRYFVGASESSKLLDMDSYGDMHTYHLTKLGVFGFENQVKLEFSIGHLFEDLAGDTAIKIARECWGIKDFGAEDIGVLPSLPGTWASIDKVITGEGLIPWAFIKKWDPTWQCGWELTKEEIATGGVHLGELNMELKTGVNYKIVNDISEVIFPSQEHVVQTQEQMRAAGLQKNPHYTNRRYTIICQMKPPFVNHSKEESRMMTTILGSDSPSGMGDLVGSDYWRAVTAHYGKPWITTMWLVRKDQAFLDAAEKRINYFMEQHHKVNTSFYDYPPDIPQPQLPRCIYLGSYAFEGPKKDVRINMVKDTQVEGCVNEAPSIDQLRLIEETKDGRMFFPRPGSLALQFEDDQRGVNYYTGGGE